MVPIFINKNVFQPSYNDLKFTVPNHNNVCINLIFALIHLKTPNYIYLNIINKKISTNRRLIDGKVVRK